MLDLQGVCIESSTDYGKFKTLVGNRRVDEPNIKRLLASIGEKHLASVAIVNKNFEIIDGTHRWYVAKELGYPFNFIVMDDYGIDEVHILNSNMKNWSNEDFVRQFSDRFINGEKQFEDYFKLVVFMDENNLRLNNALLLMEGGVKSGTIPLRSGAFKIYETAEEIERILSELIELEKTLGSRIMTQAFWQTYIIMQKIEGFDPDRFLNKIRRFKGELDESKDSFPSLITLFEDSYNTGRARDLNIAFAAKQIEKNTRRDRKTPTGEI